MTAASNNPLPEWAAAAVALLRGTVYGSDERLWAQMLTNRAALETYVGQIGLVLVVDEAAPGIAYLRQRDDDESPDAGPTLLRQTRLSYGQTVLCVLLRDEYRRYEDGATPDQRCVATEAAMLDQWAGFFPADTGEKKLLTNLRNGLKRLAEIGFVRKLKSSDPSWEVLPILKARITVDVLEQLREQLARHPGGRVATSEPGERQGTDDD